MKRRKRRGGDDDDSDEDDDDEESEDEDDGSDSDEEEEEEDACPPGCDNGVYESVLELREKRLDMEEALAEIQKTVEELKRAHTKYISDEKKVEKEQGAADLEITAFQFEKQQRLNEVLMPLTLRLSQVQCLEESGSSENALPASLNDYVVFPNKRLQTLMSRITELVKEKQDVRLSFRELKRDLKVRSKGRVVIDKEIEELQAKYHQIQLLKFGKSVDLDALEASQDRSHLVGLEAKIKELEGESDEMLKVWKAKVEKARKLNAKETNKNSELVEGVVKLGRTKLELDKALNSRLQNVAIKDDVGENMRLRAEDELKTKIAENGREIAALQQEIQLFRRKGGHIYTTVTSNRS